MSACILIFGAGWLGRQFQHRLHNAVLSPADIADEVAVLHEIDRVKPARIINCAGKTGKPNIDACEKNPGETLRSNVAGPIVLGHLSTKKGIPLVHLGSGCLYQGDHGGKGFREEDAPNFFGSLYSRSKALAESALKECGALQLRLRMPLSGQPDPRNLITKLITYKKVFRLANSVTILEDFFPAAERLMEEEKTGVFNLVNEGVEYHDDLLRLYQEIVDPTFRFEIVTFEEIRKTMTADRSNCLLNTDKLKAVGAALPPLEKSLPKIFLEYKKNLGRR